MVLAHAMIQIDASALSAHVGFAISESQKKSNIQINKLGTTNRNIKILVLSGFIHLKETVDAYRSREINVSNISKIKIKIKMSFK